MHEVYKTQELLRAALAAVGPGRRVRRLRVLIGEASGFTPGEIEACYRTVATGTAAEGAVLEFTTEPLAARCARCGAEYHAAAGLLSCRACGSTRLSISGGMDARLLGADPDA